MGSCLATYFKPNEQGVRGTRYKRVPTDSTKTTYGSSDNNSALRGGGGGGGAYSGEGTGGSASSAAKCQACGINFNTKSELSAHIATTHSGNIEKQVKKNRKKKKDDQKRKEERVNLYKDIRNGDAYSNPKIIHMHNNRISTTKKSSR